MYEGVCVYVMLESFSERLDHSLMEFDLDKRAAPLPSYIQKHPPHCLHGLISMGWKDSLVRPTTE